MKPKEFAILPAPVSITVSDNVIEDALRDTPEDSTFSVPWIPNPDDALSRVYDWLLDTESPYYLYYDGSKKAPPSILQKGAVEVLKVQGELFYITCDRADEVFILGTLDVEDFVQGYDFLLIGDRPVRDLSNGLVPMALPVGDVAEEDEEPSLELTEEDILSMPLAALKRVAKNQGIDVAGAKKDDIIAALLSVPKEETDPAPADEAYPSMLSITISQDGTAWGVDSDGRPHMLSPLKGADVYQVFSWAGAKPYEPF